MRNKKSFILIFIISGLIIFLSKCINNTVVSNDPRGNVYIGSVSCRQCHQSIYDTFIATGHYNTTRGSSEKNILGSFTSGKNTFVFNAATKMVMEHRDSGFFQVLYVNGKEQEAHRFDITFGLKHAQTFLYWQQNKTFELPVSWYTSLNTWATSPGPGFSSTNAYFKRSIGKDCFECHSSFIENKLIQTPNGIEEVLDKASLITGIDCERCHGPAINHVNYHLAYPDVKDAKYIVSAHSLTRQQKLDACAVCHSGNDKQKEISAFKFKLGDTLANLFLPWSGQRDKNSDFDVHGNQYQLLAKSKCFLASKTLDCSTCHNPHTDAGKDLSEYSRQCISCHQQTDHSSLKIDGLTANKMKSNCIDCHMPEQPSRAIIFQLEGSKSTSPYMLRNHNIAVYRDEKVNDLIRFLKKI